MGAVHIEIEIGDLVPGVFGGESGALGAARLPCPRIGAVGGEEFGEVVGVGGDGSGLGRSSGKHAEIIMLEFVLVDREDEAPQREGLPDGEVAGDEGEVGLREVRGSGRGRCRGIWRRASGLPRRARRGRGGGRRR